MPRQVHFLLFTREELITAVSEYGRVSHVVPQAGHLVRASMWNAMEGPCVSLIVGTDAGEETAHDFEAIDVRNALLNFCEMRRIPISRHAQITVERQGRQVALLVRSGAVEPYAKALT